MAEQLKECLIVHAASIFTKRPLVNGLGGDIALWIGKPADWIFTQKISCFLDKKDSFMEQTKKMLTIIIMHGQVMTIRATL